MTYSLHNKLPASNHHYKRCKAIKKNYKGYVFTVNNTLKDLTYINELFKKDCNANKISKLFKNYYKNSIKKGYGNLLISELVNKKDF